MHFKIIFSKNTFFLKILSSKFLFIISPVFTNSTKYTLEELNQKKLNVNKLKESLKVEMRKIVHKKGIKIDSEPTLTKIGEYYNHRIENAQKKRKKKQINSDFQIEQIKNCITNLVKNLSDNYDLSKNYKKEIIKFIQKEFNNDAAIKDSNFLLNKQNNNFVLSNIIRFLNENHTLTIENSLSNTEFPILSELLQFNALSEFSVQKLNNVIDSIAMKEKSINKGSDKMPSNRFSKQIFKLRLKLKKINEIFKGFDAEVQKYFELNLEKLVSIFDFITFQNNLNFHKCNISKEDEPDILIQIEKIIREKEKIKLDLEKELKKLTMEESNVIDWICYALSIVSLCIGTFLIGILIGIKKV